MVFFCETKTNTDGKEIITDVLCYYLGGSEYKFEKYKKRRTELISVNGDRYKEFDMSIERLETHVIPELAPFIQSLKSEHETIKKESHDFMYHEPDKAGKLARRIFRVNGWAPIETSKYFLYFIIFVFVVLFLIYVLFKGDSEY